MSKIEDLGSILGVWAHPEDGIFASAGAMITASRNGHHVACISASRGEQGKWDQERFPGANIKTVRHLELVKALQVIGTEDHRYLNLMDGEMASYDIHQPVSKITEIIDSLKPDTVITFGPDGYNLSSDHRTISRCVDKAVRDASHQTRLLFAVQEANHVTRLEPEVSRYFAAADPVIYSPEEIDYSFKLSGRILDDKIKALDELATQTIHLRESLGDKSFAKLFQNEFYVEASNAKPFI